MRAIGDVGHAVQGALQLEVAEASAILGAENALHELVWELGAAAVVRARHPDHTPRAQTHTEVLLHARAAEHVRAGGAPHALRPGHGVQAGRAIL